MREFIWTDDLVNQLLCSSTSCAEAERWIGRIEAFKASKQPKPEWEILTYNHFENGVDVPDFFCTTNGYCKIHSVKRLSDGEVFTVGDEVGYFTQNGTYASKIDIFYIASDGHSMMAKRGSGGVNITCLNKIHESIPVLLTPSEIEKLKKMLNA